jgi:hypothetical protein
MYGGTDEAFEALGLQKQGALDIRCALPKVA